MTAPLSTPTLKRMRELAERVLAEGQGERAYFNARTLLRIIELVEGRLTPLKGGEAQWMPIETAPKDGTAVLLLASAHHVPAPDENGNLTDVFIDAFAAIGTWNAEGTSWVDESGIIGCERAHHLEVTGTWHSGGGWFQPDEVSHWMPLPSPPSESPSALRRSSPLPSVEPPPRAASGVTREEIAKIIDPIGFDEPGHTDGVFQSNEYLAGRRVDAFRKADAILALLARGGA